MQTVNLLICGLGERAWARRLRVQVSLGAHSEVHAEVARCHGELERVVLEAGGRVILGPRHRPLEKVDALAPRAERPLIATGERRVDALGEPRARPGQRRPAEEAQQTHRHVDAKRIHDRVVGCRPASRQVLRRLQVARAEDGRPVVG